MTEFGVLLLIFRMRVKRIYGPSNISYGINELLLTCVLRNGEFYIKSFMKHYCAMGIKHFVFLDNCSTDRSVEMLCKYDNVTVLQTNAPYKKYENTMKRYLVEKFSMGLWNICADIDEFFDYPYSSILTLHDFLGYLNENHYTAVVTQLLDLFSDKPLTELDRSGDEFIQEKFKYYDISGIRKHNYGFSKYPLDKIKFHHGGIRRLIFGTNNGLTKTSLIFMDRKVESFVEWHHTRNTRIADISCVLKHYPFISSFYEKVRDAIRTGRYGMFGSEYKAYWKKLKSTPNLNLKLETSQCFDGLEKLIDQEFIIVSEQYQKWVSKYKK